jgi:hypothetical protein
LQDVKEVLDSLTQNIKECNMSRTINKRNERIENLIRDGLTHRQVADKVGVHHRTVQRVGEAREAYSARSTWAIEADFSPKGVKAFRKARSTRF